MVYGLILKRIFLMCVKFMKWLLVIDDVNIFDDINFVYIYVIVQ